MFRVVVFGGGSRIWERSANRLAGELRSSRLFSRVEVFTPESLVTELPDFWSTHSAFLSGNKRGFGYWLWKPHIVAKVLNGLAPEEEGVLYMDAGCTFNFRTDEAMARFDDYIKLTRTSGGLFFRLSDGNNHEKYTKASVLSRFSGMNLGQKNLVAATAFFLAKGEGANALLNKWSEVMVSENYSFLIDNHPSESQSEKFLSHRHDQSLLSILLEYSNFTILEDETYFSPDWFRRGLGFPIWATRHKSAYPFRGESIVWKTVSKIESIISR